jgi:hypothetical protein
MKFLGFQFRLRLGRWSIEFSNEDWGPWLGLWRHTENGSAFPRWQWDFRKKPVMMKREQMPVLECTGVRLVPVELIKDEPWAYVVGDK